MQRKVFFGIGAEYQSGPPDKLEILAVMYSGQQLNPANKFTINVTATPSSATTELEWNSIQADDRGWNFKRAPIVVPMDPLTGAPVTTIGNGGLNTESRGGLYLESSTFAANRAKILADSTAVWPPKGYEEYELTTLAYRNDAGVNPTRAGMRFVGFRAHLVEQRGSLVKVLLRWNPDNQWRGPVWLDLDDPEDCDNTQGDTQDPNDPLRRFAFAGNGTPQGALFIRMERFSRLVNQETLPRGPKLPIGHG